jgi:hypothetical protein
MTNPLSLCKSFAELKWHGKHLLLQRIFNTENAQIVSFRWLLPRPDPRQMNPNASESSTARRKQMFKTLNWRKPLPRKP